MKRKTVSTENAPGAIGPYSQAISAAGLVFVSGQLPINPATGQFAGESIEEQTRQALSNIRAILEAAGSDMGRIVKTTVYLADMNDFAGMNAVYSEFFAANYPARAAFQVAKLPLNASVEIEAVAAVQD